MQVLHREQQADAGGDLVVGDVALGPAERALGDQLVHVLDQPRERGEVAAHVLVGRLVEVRRQRDDRQRRAARDRHRHAGPGALEEGGDRRVVLLQRRPGEPPRNRLQHLVAPRLGGLDGGAALGVGRQQRRAPGRARRAQARSPSCPAHERRSAAAPGRSRPGSRARAGSPGGGPRRGRCAGSRSPSGAASAPPRASDATRARRTGSPSWRGSYGGERPRRCTRRRVKSLPSRQNHCLPAILVCVQASSVKKPDLIPPATDGAHAGARTRPARLRQSALHRRAAGPVRGDRGGWRLDHTGQDPPGPGRGRRANVARRRV